MQPLEKLLKEETLVIFPRIKELVEVHSHFLDRLRESTEPNSNLKLSSVFLEFREQFLIYGDYCSRMIEATDTLKEVCKRSQAIDQLVNVSKLYFDLKGNKSSKNNFISNAKKITATEKCSCEISYQCQCNVSLSITFYWTN
jgi:RhoGEF domain